MSTHLSLCFIVFNDQFREDKVERELRYFKREAGKSFERTYGWAWLVKLHEDLLQLRPQWSDALQPLVQHVVQIWTDFLPHLVYPVRVGEHTNSAFGLSFAIDYARSVLSKKGSSENILCRNVGGNGDFENLIVNNASQFFKSDKYPPLLTTDCTS